MKYLQLFHDGLDSFEVLTDEEAGQLIKAIISHNKGVEVELKGALNALFMLFKNEIERTKEVYDNKCKANKANGSLGGRPKTQDNRTVKKITEKTQDKDKDKDKYSIFINELKSLVSIKSKVNSTKDGKKLFEAIKDTEKLKADYVTYQLDKKDFAVRITPFMEDYNNVVVSKQIDMQPRANW